MVHVEQTEDLEMVRAVITHPKLYRWLTDDYSPGPESITTGGLAGGTYLHATDGEENLGIFSLSNQNGACIEIHTCLLPCSWGQRAREAARAAIAWIWANTRAHRIITNVPGYNRQALKFALAAGLEEFGVNPQSFMKHGRLHDQTMLGISRHKEHPCHYSPRH